MRKAPLVYSATQTPRILLRVNCGNKVDKEEDGYLRTPPASILGKEQNAVLLPGQRKAAEGDTHGHVRTVIPMDACRKLAWFVEGSRYSASEYRVSLLWSPCSLLSVRACRLLGTTLCLRLCAGAAHAQYLACSTSYFFWTPR
ncbi:hypothetical protein NDU88_008811 [Pleurodeles waltl]|uniref:Uncharacterized protein n=1 Tax=Pleurodeles waltl TaxID=8319 RepID=A0AAV7QPN7_PLEWA|nr:hypothetical protein NDU88_008811 [Pleurodeles waltl]